MENEAGRFTLIFLGVPGDEGGEVELTYNWDESGYGGGRNFGHLAYQVDDIYETCQRLMDAGVTINRPPRDGRMAFVRTPDNISIELLQKGAALAAGRALGVDAEQRRMVGWPRPPVPRPGRDASTRSSRRRWPAPAASSSASRRSRAARSARCRARCSRRTRCASRSPRSARASAGRSTSISSATECRPTRTTAPGERCFGLITTNIGVEPGNGGALRLPFDEDDVRRGRGGAARGRQLPFRPARRQACSIG